MNPNAKLHFGQVIEKSGAPGLIRTGDLLLRRQTLYPAELRARCFQFYQFCRKENLRVPVRAKIFKVVGLAPIGLCWSKSGEVAEWSKAAVC